jgi:hypothetical protein
VRHIICQTLQLCPATSRKVAGLIPDEVMVLFNWPNPSSRIMALGSTEALTEISIRDLPGGKGWLSRACKDHLADICELIV